MAYILCPLLNIINHDLLDVVLNTFECCKVSFLKIVGKKIICQVILNNKKVVFWVKCFPPFQLYKLLNVLLFKHLKIK